MSRPVTDRKFRNVSQRPTLLVGTQRPLGSSFACQPGRLQSFFFSIVYLVKVNKVKSDGINQQLVRVPPWRQSWPETSADSRRPFSFLLKINERDFWFFLSFGADASERNQVRAITFSWQRIHNTRTCTVDYGRFRRCHLLTVLNVMNDTSSGRSCPVDTIETKIRYRPPGQPTCTAKNVKNSVNSNPTFHGVTMTLWRVNVLLTHKKTNVIEYSDISFVEITGCVPLSWQGKPMTTSGVRFFLICSLTCASWCHAPLCCSCKFVVICTPNRRREMSEYERIRRSCLKRGELYEDADFATTSTSIFYHQSPPFQFTWKRPKVPAKLPLGPVDIKTKISGKMESFPFIGCQKNSNQSARRTMNGSNVKVVLFFFIWRVDCF